MSGNPLLLGPSIITAVPPTYSPNGHPGGGFDGGVGSASALAEVFQWIKDGNERFYQNNVPTNSRHYKKPEDDASIVKALVEFSLPELAAIPGYLGDAFKKTMTEAEYNALKTVAQKNSLFTKVALAGSAVASDIDLGVHPVAAVSTQATLLVGGALITAAVAATGAGTLPILAIGLIVSVMVEELGVQSNLNQFFSNVLGIATNEVEAAIPLSGFQIYQAINEIIRNPESHPEGEKAVLELLKQVGNANLAELVQSDASSGKGAQGMYPLPETIILSEQPMSQDGYRVAQAEAQDTTLFIGDESFNRMTGGGGTNWFMVKENWALEDDAGDRGKNIVVGGPGFNVLAFSTSPQPVQIILTGDDYMNARIEQLDNDTSRRFGHGHLNEMEASQLRYDDPWLDSLYERPELYSQYKNIQMVIGSPYDDILVGNWLGGNVFNGGAGDDVFVLHGGSNKIKFLDSDFSQVDIAKKMIHGLILWSEAKIFNGHYYNPSTGGYWRIEPDKLDFSSVDANLVEEGRQRFDFIFNQEFSGVAGELRVERLSSDDSLFSIQADRTGDGVADFIVEYKIYNNIFISPEQNWEGWVVENSFIL